MAGVLAVVSVLLLVAIHRVEVVAGGVHWPLGLVMGAIFQLAASVFLLTSTGRRLPVLVLLIAWGVLAMPFAGSGPGGGVLMPGQIAGKPQYSGYLIQIIGVGIPLLVLAGAQIAAIRRAGRERAGRRSAEASAPASRSTTSSTSTR